MTDIPIANTWPDTIPLPLLGCSGMARNATLVSPKTNLAIGRRNRFTKSYVGVSATWCMSVGEYDTFQTFWQDNLGNGAASFAIELRYPLNSILTDWIVKFVSRYRATWINGMWQVEAELDLLHSTIQTPDPEPPVDFGGLYVESEDSFGQFQLLVTSDDFNIYVAPA